MSSDECVRNRRGGEKWKERWRIAADLVRSSPLEPHLLKGDGVGLKFSLGLLGKLVDFGSVGGAALYGAEAAVRTRRSKGLVCLLSCRGCQVDRPLSEVGLREGCAAVGLGGAEVVGRREIELGGLLSGRRRG